MAAEIALILEEWGHAVGLLLVGPPRAGGGAQGDGALAGQLKHMGVAVPLCVDVQIMDTPHPRQVRAAVPGAESATDEEALELMEMILGALGRDAVGLGARWGFQGGGGLQGASGAWE